MTERLDSMKENRERELLDAELRRAAQARAEADEELIRLARERAEAQARVDALRRTGEPAETWAHRWPVLLAVASAVLLAFLLGLYVGWQQPLG